MKNASALGAMARLVKRSMSLRRKIASGLSQRLAAWRLFLMKRGQRRVFDSLAQQHGDRFIALAEADVSRFCTPAWLARTREAQAALWPRPSNAFLKEPFIRQTMAVESRELMARELSFLEERYSVQLLRQLLMEDVVGTPTILSPRYLTSGTSVHHFCHAASYEVATGVSLRGLRSVVEWGGGYGDMAKLLLRMNPSLVYTIVDIPIFSWLQWLYLSTVLGNGEADLVTGAPTGEARGRVRIVPLNVLERVDLECELFIATWSLSESSLEAQQYVAEKRCFGAEHLLFGFQARTERFPYAERLRRIAPERGSVVVPVPFLPDNWYLFR